MDLFVSLFVVGSDTDLLEDRDRFSLSVKAEKRKEISLGYDKLL